MERTLLIEKYLDNTLSVNEREVFEQLKGTDRSFQEELSMGLALKAALQAKERATLYQDLDALFERTVAPQLPDDNRKRGIKAIRIWRHGVFQIAASVSLILICWLAFETFREKKSMPELYEAYYRPFKVSNVRSDTKEGVYWSGVELYQKGDFRSALFVFEGMDSTDIQGAMFSLPIVIANCHINLNDFGQARSVLVSIASNHPFYSDAVWYQALISLKEGDGQRAKNLLEKLIAEKSIYSRKSKELFEKLD